MSLLIEDTLYRQFAPQMSKIFRHFSPIHLKQNGPGLGNLHYKLPQPRMVCPKGANSFSMREMISLDSIPFHVINYACIYTDYIRKKLIQTASLMHFIKASNSFEHACLVTSAFTETHFPYAVAWNSTEH